MLPNEPGQVLQGRPRVYLPRSLSAGAAQDMHAHMSATSERLTNTDKNTRSYRQDVEMIFLTDMW